MAKPKHEQPIVLGPEQTFEFESNNGGVLVGHISIRLGKSAVISGTDPTQYVSTLWMESKGYHNPFGESRFVRREENGLLVPANEQSAEIQANHKPISHFVGMFKRLRIVRMLDIKPEKVGIITVVKDHEEVEGLENGIFNLVRKTKPKLFFNKLDTSDIEQRVSQREEQARRREVFFGRPEEAVVVPVDSPGPLVPETKPRKEKLQVTITPDRPTIKSLAEEDEIRKNSGSPGFY